MTKAALTFDAFLKQRGFDPKSTGAFFRRMFVTCWGERGFHRFWRLWNPLYGYLLFRLYVLLGGAKRPLSASFVVFTLCGFALHDALLIATTRRLSLTCTITFVTFWGLSVASRAWEKRLSLGRGRAPRSRAVNALSNAAWIGLGLAVGALAGPRLVAMVPPR